MTYMYLDGNVVVRGKKRASKPHTHTHMHTHRAFGNYGNRDVWKEIQTHFPWRN